MLPSNLLPENIHPFAKIEDIQLIVTDRRTEEEKDFHEFLAMESLSNGFSLSGYVTTTYEERFEKDIAIFKAVTRYGGGR
ncbi:hypothetical protein ACFSGI_08965 [Paenibacillus nicotianae]|uniref:Uncharacterized protein n=1 Tax=Paenibacillus nicotianae TaxID=1526551 RepID=A0ABW4UV28_9BACL